MTKKPVVLVVDDDQDQLLTIAAVLEDHGYEVLSCDTPAAALETAQKSHIDIVVADVRMPKMDGTQLARELKSLPNRKSLPVILLTACQEAVEFSADKGAADALCIKQELKQRLPEILKEKLGLKS